MAESSDSSQPSESSRSPDAADAGRGGASALFQLIKDQQERVAILATAVTLGVGVIQSLLDQARPPILSLAVFSALAAGGCLWMLFARGAPEADGRRRRLYSARRIVAACVIACIGLASAWGFVYRERILFSPFAHQLAGGHRVLVSDTVAWQVLQPSTPTQTGGTVVGELAALLEGLAYRPVVMSEQALEAFEPAGTDGFILRGVAEQIGAVLDAGMILTVPRVERLLKQVETPLTLVDDHGEDTPALGWLPAERFFRNPFLVSKFQIRLPVAQDASAELRATFARLVIRYAVATMLFYDGDPDAGRVFREILGIGSLLPQTESPELSSIYQGAAYYFVSEGQNREFALRALEAAQGFDPADASIKVARIYLLLASDRVLEAGALIHAMEPIVADPAALQELRAEYHMVREERAQAIAAMEAALQYEADPYYRFRLHLGAAGAYGMVSDSVPGRAKRMIWHLEDASRIEPEASITHIMQGFAWSIEGNAALSRRAFERARPLLRNESDQQLYRYWLGRSLFELGQASEALEGLLADLGEEDDAGLMLVIAQNLIQVGSRDEEAEAFLDRVIELNPELAKAYRYKALIIVKRAVALQASAAEERHALMEKARVLMLRAVEGGDHTTANHELIATLYEEMGDRINAEKHWEMVCALSPSSATCLLSRATREIAAGDFDAARETSRQMEAAAPADGLIRTHLAIEWQKAGLLDEAEAAYRDAVRLADSDPTAHNNLAYVLYDKKSYDEALSHWERSLELHPDEPDALAGRALALEALGRRTEAVASFERAVSLDESYLQCDVLRREALWSEAACDAARPLIAQLRTGQTTAVDLRD